MTCRHEGQTGGGQCLCEGCHPTLPEPTCPAGHECHYPLIGYGCEFAHLCEESLSHEHTFVPAHNGTVFVCSFPGCDERKDWEDFCTCSPTPNDGRWDDPNCPVH
jgi:hypothetical protein